MKRRTLSLLCALALCLSLVTANAAAAEEEEATQRVIVGGVTLDDAQGAAYALTDSAGAVTTQGAGESSWNIKLENGVLTLRDAVIAQGFAHDGGSAGLYAEGDLELVLVGENTIGATGMNEGIHALADLTIGGEGSLDVSVSGEGSCCGICVGQALTVTGGTVNVSAAGEGDCNGIHSGEYDLVISGGQVSAAAASRSGTSCGIRNEYEVYLTGGSLRVTASSDSGESWGISTTYTLIVQGEDTSLTAQGGTQAIQGKRMLFCNELLYDISGKQTIQIAGSKVMADDAYLPTLDREPVWVNGVQIYGGTEPGYVEGVSYDPATNTLTLDGAYITKAYAYNEEAHAAGIYSIGNLNVKLLGTNTIAGGSDMSDGICVDGKLTIDGPGSLDISVASDIRYVQAIYGGYLHINGCALDLTCSSTTCGVYGLFSEFDGGITDSTVNIDCVSDSSVCQAVYTYDDFFANNSTLNISSTAARYTVGIYCSGDAVINGGALTVSAVSTATGECDGVYASKALTIRDCTVRASADTVSEEYLATGLSSGGNLTVSGGDIVAEGRDCGVQLYSTIDSAFYMNGGHLTALSENGDAIIVYGTEFTLCVGTDGTLILDAPTPIGYMGEGAGFTYTVTNEGTLSAKVGNAEQAQKLLDAGGALTLALGADLEGDLTVPAGADLVIDGGGQYALRGAITSEGSASLTLQDLTLDGGNEKEHAVSGAGGLQLTMDSCAVSGYTGQALDLGSGSSCNGATERNWYYDALCYAWGNGLLDYADDGQHTPSSPITRAALITALWRMAGQPTVDFAVSFTDVAADAACAEAVRWAAGVKILENSSGSFGPEESVTREEAITLLYRYAQAQGYDVSVGEDTNILSYADIADVSEGAMAAMQWACGAGIIQGDSGGSLLEPLASCTYAQAASMLMRLAA